MASFNRVILMGNLTRDPEVSYLPSGTAVADMGLAIDDSYKNREGEMVERTCFVDIKVWARQAETCAQYLSKGSPVLVEGRLQLDKWQTKEGDNRSKLRVRADRVQFLGGPRGSELSDGPGDAPKRQQADEGDAAPAAPAAVAPAAAVPPPEPEPPMVADLADDDNLPF